MAFFQNSTYEMVRHTTIPKMNFYLTNAGYSSPHVHSDMEILFLIDGHIEITTREERFMLTSGQLALFNPYQTHAYTSDSETTLILIIQIDVTFCRSYYPQLENIRFNTSHISRVIPEKYLTAMTDTCFNIGYNYFSEVLAYEFLCIGDVNRLMFLLLNYVPFQSLSDRELTSIVQTQERLERILMYIHDHFQEKLSLSDIAEREHLSVAYLSRFFKSQIGQSFQAYVNALRLEQAVSLLQNTRKTILDISIESGFSDLKYMTKAFSENFHMSASAYRKLHQNVLSQDTSSLPDVQTTDESELNAAGVFSKETSLRILRRFHHFDCDQDDSPNRIYAT